MDNMIYLLFVCIFVPILMMAALVEKKAQLPIIIVLVGLFVSLLSAELNALLRTVIPISHYTFTVVVAPISEEILKALPVLFFVVAIKDKIEPVVTIAMATGIGFALLENSYYLLATPGFTVVDAVIRAFGAGLMHGMCTLLVGVGISFVKKKRKVFFAGTFALLSTAITYHAIYNMLVQSQFVSVGSLLPIATYVPFLIWRIKSKKAASG